MTITVPFTKRTGRYYKSDPWVQRVIVWHVGANRPEGVLGAWLQGDGGNGELEIEAGPGDVIRWGQRDHVDVTDSIFHWGYVDVTGIVVPCSELASKRKYNAKLKLLARIKEAVEDFKERNPDVENLP